MFDGLSNEFWKNTSLYIAIMYGMVCMVSKNIASHSA